MSDHTVMVIWVIKTFFVSSLCILAASSWCLLFLLGPYNICLLSCPSLHEMFPWYLLFFWRDLESFQFCCFPLFLCTFHLRRLSYLSLLFFGTLHSDRYIFTLSALFFTSLLFSALLRPPQTTILPCYIHMFLGDGFGHHLLYSVMNICPYFFRHSVYQI